MTESVAAPAQPAKGKRSKSVRSEAVVAPVREPKDPWDQRPDDNDRWYGRFLRYVALGPTRSISLVVRGRRNAYPVPAHWPAQAVQRDWKARAQAFDAQIAKELKLRNTIEDPCPTKVAFDNTLKLFSDGSGDTLDEIEKLQAAVAAGGYQLPPDDDDEEDLDSAAIN